MTNNTTSTISTARLEDFTGGWFIGNFTPSLLTCKEVEVAIKRYKAGDEEECHVHRVAIEFTAVIEGKVEMNGETHEAGSIVIVPPGNSTGFRAITDAVTTVIKLPSVPQDKYPADHA